VSSEEGDVGLALAERRNAEVDDVEAEEEVFAEAAGLDHLGEIAVGGGEDAGVDGDGVVGADGANFFLLEGAEELGLEVEGEFADLVEEDSAAIGGGEKAGLGAVGSGEGAFDVAEEFAFDEGGDEGAAVDRATSSLPVPDSPRMRTGWVEKATLERMR
jgi:hypothetical protein